MGLHSWVFYLKRDAIAALSAPLWILTLDTRVQKDSREKGLGVTIHAQGQLMDIFK